MPKKPSKPRPGAGNPRGGSEKKVTHDQCLKVIEQADGNREVILSTLKISNRTFARYLAEWDDCKQAYHDSRHKRQLVMATQAEKNIYDAMRSGDVHTSRWFLTNTRIGRAMGYGTAIEHTGKDGKPLLPGGFKTAVDDSPISSGDD